MVKRSELELDDSLFEGEEKSHRLRRGRADNALAVVIALTVAMVALLVFTSEKENWWAVAMLGILFLASELFALPMKPSGRLSLALLVVVMAMMISGPLGAAVVTLFGIPVYWLEREEQGAKKVIFNTCQMMFAAGAAAWVFHYTGGALLEASLKNGGKLVFPWVLAMLVFYILNTVLITPVLTPDGESMTRFWQRRMLPRSPGYLLYGGIGFMAAALYVRLEFPAVLLLFAPLIAIRVVFTRYESMRDVCDKTTLAVMEAVEGPGTPMEGHSVGVAAIALAIAEEMNFQERDLHYLRQAALLHDIGKLALDPAIFAKDGPLTPEEYEEMKKHPLIGGRIVSREPSFAVVAPAITHHHEMTDGSGYVDGLAAEAIPIGARILAVADSFDAMQRPAAYRESLSPYDAASEIIKAKGIQYDPEVVDAFVNVVARRGIWTGLLKDSVPMPSDKVDAEPETGLEPEQPTLEDAVGGVVDISEEERERTATPADGIKYDEVRSEIEKDIVEWERAEGDRTRRKARGEPGRRAGSRKKAKKKDKGPKGEKKR
ncbi:MAG: HD domain-containing protein [Actinobacteria bacterium]|nr:HD domain-containing protein [Actinomycetota bacterium]MCG2819820.1 HD domain-containing protein [Actinomycetes bacterium]MBU4178712.1 HD domain-containing protein [Actinomycetota bacterium]MBU4217778.1 HD domain-containing protein [Actinomycetota bacterium]MBU4358009.1 HD domain-containing protein [Actinomycetota bacterium]